MLLIPIFLLFCSWNASVQCSSENTGIEQNPNSFLGSPCNASDENSCLPQSMYYCACGSSSSDDCRNLHREVVESGRCACKSGYTSDKESNTCLATRIGQSCQIGFQCRRNLGEYSACSDERVCVCQHPTAPNEADTKCLTKVGGHCTQSNECVGHPLLGRCSTDRECVCRDASAISSANGETCLPLRYKTGESCAEREQCRARSDSKTKNLPASYHNPLYDCVNGSCACASSAVLEENEKDCHAKAIYVGQECDVDVQCQANLGPSSTCSSMYSEDPKICICVSGSVPVNNFASCGSFGPVPIGWPCGMNQTCSGKEGTTSLCTPAGMCQCEQGYIASRLLDDCLPIRNNLGEDCLEPQQCAGENRECGGDIAGRNICKCVSGWVQPSGEDKCYLIASKVWDSCERHIQCVAGVGSSQCVNNRCRCVAGANDPEVLPKMRRCIAI